MKQALLLVLPLAACGGSDLHDIPNGAPTAVIDAPAAASAGVPVPFNGARSSDPDGDALTYAWDFGDGGSETGDHGAHTYASEGAYRLTLTVADGRGGTDVAAVDIEVGAPNEPPVASFNGPSSAAPGESVTFDASSSTDPDGDVVDYAWSFGDGASASGAVVQKAFAAAGTVQVTLTVTDDRGATDVATGAVDVSTPSYDGTWSWGLVNEADRPDGNCGPFVDSILAIAVSGTSITVTENPGATAVVYSGFLDGAHFIVTNEMAMGLGTQTIDATFDSATHFEGTYRVVSGLASCDRTRAVRGDKQ